MTDSPTRAAAYVRESAEEQGQGFSPDAQRQAIASFATENTLELIGEYCDFHSGWRKSEGRPAFQRLMADAADGKFDMVLVYHTSRFARNQVEARRYKQLLRERLGIRVEDFTRFWDAEPDPAERRKLVLSLFEQVWQKDGQIVAVKPNHAFASYFTAASEARATRPKADADDEATKAGATGVKPAFVTPRSRFGSSPTR
ncbi:MAG TPA: recombinase family protein [Solirubrobacteraceae bacterium]|jgi:hypothetical protein|nr:recombinase family protein [Solirubrobacteraceae bacterium]